MLCVDQFVSRFQRALMGAFWKQLPSSDLNSSHIFSVSPPVCRAVPLLVVSQCGWNDGDTGAWYCFILRTILYDMTNAEITLLSNDTILILAYHSLCISASNFAIFKNFRIIKNACTATGCVAMRLGWWWYWSLVLLYFENCSLWYDKCRDYFIIEWYHFNFGLSFPLHFGI